jgi:hypothetical protein
MLNPLKKYNFKILISFKAIRCQIKIITSIRSINKHIAKKENTNKTIMIVKNYKIRIIIKKIKFLQQKKIMNNFSHLKMIREKEIFRMKMKGIIMIGLQDTTKKLNWRNIYFLLELFVC